MDNLVLFNNTIRKKILNKRFGESKFGEHVQILTSISNIYEQLKNLDVSYILLGLPEDIGIVANYGKTGASKAWDATLKSLINIQSNSYTKANRVLILGYLDFSRELQEVSEYNCSPKKDVIKARKIVESIDASVSYLVHQIILAGKTPIIIGGGHNNAYGNIKGTSLALKKPINIINFDAHSDFRAEEGRHSGNAFSYAYAEGFLGTYFIFGLHENYTSDAIFTSLKKLKNVKYNTFEALEIRNELKFKNELECALNYISHDSFGIEIDCDAIENIPSSAMSPSGFSVTKIRSFVSYFAKHKNATYLHICEAAPTNKTANQVGKLLAYLITDFIKAKES